MSNSNNRSRNPETVHHLVSRIAHRVYFLEDDERTDFLEIVRRASLFSGIELLGWCVMTNHFHLMVYLPTAPFVEEAEVLRRYGILKGVAAAERMASEFAVWRMEGEIGGRRVLEWLDRQRRRMYDVGCFMKIVKQWFTEEYNRRHSHKGTLWESAYYDRLVARNVPEMAKCLGYIHLNPIRGAASDRFDGYVWSSYSAFRKGDPTAVRGMRFVYGDEVSDSEIVEMHEALLEVLLEEEKLRRAGEIARKRAAGYEMPADRLTTEAMIAQKLAQLEEVQKASIALNSEKMPMETPKLKKESRESMILALLSANPDLEVPQVAERMGVALSTVYRLIAGLKKRGLLKQERHGGSWTFSQ